MPTPRSSAEWNRVVDWVRRIPLSRAVERRNKAERAFEDAERELQAAERAVNDAYCRTYRSKP